MGNGFLGLGGWEPLVLIIVFLVVVGPQRLPEVTRQLISWVRQARRWVESSRATVEDEMGIAIDDLKKYDPRQYDPRRIVREAWGDTSLDDLVPTKESLSIAAGGAAAAKGSTRASSRAATSAKSARAKDAGPARAPFDPEAT